MKVLYTKKIENIFSNKKTKTKKQNTKQKIIIDYREKNSSVAFELIGLGHTIEFKELKTGDYIANDAIIERKTIQDFLESMRDKRLLNQLENLKQQNKPLIIIEGFQEKWIFNENENRIHPNAIRGFLLSISLKHKIPIIFSKNSEDTARYISLIANKKESKLSLNVKKKTQNKKERIKFILEGFPGIGPKTSEKLLKEFKTIKKILNTPTEKLERIIGKKAQIIKELSESDY